MTFVLVRKHVFQLIHKLIVIYLSSFPFKKAEVHVCIEVLGIYLHGRLPVLHCHMVVVVFAVMEKLCKSLLV
jgi:hypothetical protein